jgi:hypothetical protein
MNATTFVIGETLYYKIYTRSRTDYSPSAVSRIAYIALVDNSHKKYVYTKRALEQGVGQGDFLSPPRSKPVIINCWLHPMDAEPTRFCVA